MNDSASIKGFQFTPTGIAGILKAQRLQVPAYQREYSWEKEQAQQLYSDFTRAKSENADYFLGTIVTIKSGRTAPLEIVDGQQRLTTTAILIAAIRDYLGQFESDQSAIDSITTDYLSTYDRKARAWTPRLILNIDDRTFFENLVTGRDTVPTRESHDRLTETYRVAAQHVNALTRSFDSKDHSGVLNDWLEFLEHSATVILVQTQDGSQAFKMFETLNDRGLKTSQADLVKSYLFGQAGSRISEAQSRWSSMKDNLEEIDDDDRAINFLRHSIMATRQFVRAENVYSYSQGVRGEGNSVAFLSELERLSRVYVATHRTSSSYWEGYAVTATRALSVFNYFDLKPIRPLVLALAGSFSKQEFSVAITFLVSVSVRLVITGSTRSGTIEQTFASSALSVSAGQIKDVAALKESVSKVAVLDSDFRENFAIARVSRADLARYYLRALESQLAGEAEPWYIINDDPATITLEHVLPTNASDENWPSIDEETKRRFSKRLGNLCLLTKSENNTIGDKPFAEKQATLSRAPYALTNQIGNKSDWGPAQIEERQFKLADLAVQTWPI